MKYFYFEGEQEVHCYEEYPYQNPTICIVPMDVKFFETVQNLRNTAFYIGQELNTYVQIQASISKAMWFDESKKDIEIETHEKTGLRYIEIPDDENVDDYYSDDECSRGAYYDYLKCSSTLDVCFATDHKNIDQPVETEGFTIEKYAHAMRDLGYGFDVILLKERESNESN